MAIPQDTQPMRIMMAAAMAALVTLTGWTLVSVQDLGELTAVQGSEIRHLTTQVEKIEPTLYSKDRGERVEAAIETLTVRIERLWNVINKMRGTPTGAPPE